MCLIKFNDESRQRNRGCLFRFDWLRRCASQLRKQLQHAIQVSQARTISIDKFVQHVITVSHVLMVIVYLNGKTMQKLSLNF